LLGLEDSFEIGTFLANGKYDWFDGPSINWFELELVTYSIRSKSSGVLIVCSMSLEFSFIFYLFKTLNTSYC